MTSVSQACAQKILMAAESGGFKALEDGLYFLIKLAPLEN